MAIFGRSFKRDYSLSQHIRKRKIIMPFKKTKYLSDEAILTWLVFSGLSVFVLSFVTSIFVYIYYDCWLMTSKVYMTERNCAPGLNVELALLIPVVVGTIVGTILTGRSIRNDTK